MKRLVTGLLVGSVLVAGAGAASVGYVATAFPDVPPPGPSTVPMTEARIERGKYLFENVAACATCHSTRDWTQYAGPIVKGTEGRGGDPFTPEMIPGLPGRFYAPNITPAAVGRWTDGELIRAITTGVSQSGDSLFPLMPYPHFGEVDREDIEAIVAYMRTMPAVESEVPRRSLSFPTRIMVRTLPQRARFQIRPERTDKIAYGGYLTRMAGCGECHSKTDQYRQPVEGLLYAGGVEFHLPAGGVVRSPNITPDADTGIGAWSEAAFVTRFKVWEHAPARVLAERERSRNTLMYWRSYGRMTREDLSSIYAFLRAQKPVIHRVVKRDRT